MLHVVFNDLVVVIVLIHISDVVLESADPAVTTSYVIKETSNFIVLLVDY